MEKILNVVDLFCGAGGSSSGLLQAAKEMGFGVEVGQAKALCKAILQANPA